MLRSSQPNFPARLTVLVVIKTLINAIVRFRIIKQAQVFLLLLFVRHLSFLLSGHFLSGVWTRVTRVPAALKSPCD